jgi:hypothetical protein
MFCAALYKKIPLISSFGRRHVQIPFFPFAGAFIFDKKNPPKCKPLSKHKILVLKGQCHEIFCFSFFS